VTGLIFDDATVPHRIRYQYPWRAIFFDLDGSLTGLGANSWTTPYFKHHEVAECQFDDATLTLMGGVVCDDTIEVRRIAFHGAQSSSVFRGMELKVAIYDTDITRPMIQAGTLQEYLDDEANYGVHFMKEKLKPMNSWAVPFVTGHTYRAHW
jgi:hypothetical protein